MSDHIITVFTLVAFFDVLNHDSISFLPSLVDVDTKFSIKYIYRYKLCMKGNVWGYKDTRIGTM